jgi:hypothetical protein
LPPPEETGVLTDNVNDWLAELLLLSVTFATNENCPV